MTNTFQGQTALITGAASGLGRQLALCLADEGARVAALDLQEAPLQTLADELAGKPFAWRVGDVTDPVRLEKAVRALEQELGPTELLVASAGVGRETSAWSLQPEDMEATIRVNLLGVSHSIGVVLPGMIARRRGHVLALSSLASYRGLPRMAGYCASKAGVNALMDAFRTELRGRGVHFTTACPGWVRTPMTAGLNLPARDLLDCPAACRQILAAVRRRRPFVAFPGHAARRLGVLRWLPSSVSDWLIYRMMLKLGRG